jgi:hypothetical protein
MDMRARLVSICLLLLTLLLTMSVFGQSDRGTITGTIADPAGAVVANAPIELKNSGTGISYQAASTATGNYTLAQLPVGSYEMTITVAGFKKYVRQNISVEIGQTVRLDVPLEVGATSDSVTVTTEVSLLKTEDSQITHSIPVERLQNLPILGIGGNFSSSNGLRFYMAEAQLVPGTYFQVSSLGTAAVKVNGAPSGTQRTQVDGMDATNSLNGVPASMQPSVDAIQETSILTSNYSAEFGQVGGGLFNITMRSGTNQYHGSGYDYLANEDFDAATPYTNINPRLRRNDFGGSLGGPVYIPKIYKGKDKSFFFYNREQYRESAVINNLPITVPTTAYRNGDFSGVLGAGTISNAGTTFPANPFGNAVQNGAIFDPNSTAVASNGALYRTQFVGNKIPLTSFDKVAVNIQNLIPAPGNSALINNYTPTFPANRVTTNESVKVDHQFSPKIKVSGFWGSNATGAQYSTNLNGSEGLPDTLTATRGTFTQAYTWRVNYDQTLSPTMLFHLGAGLINYPFSDHAPLTNYDQVKQLGLVGATVNPGRTPTMTGMVSTSLGGMVGIGPGVGGAQTTSREVIPAFNTSLAWVRNNHTFKFGAELRFDGWNSLVNTATNGVYNFSTAQTSQPYLGTTATGAATAGFGYASFLLGQVSTGTINYPGDVRTGKHQLGIFAQDNWKVTRKLTLDYGLRWDYSTAPKEQYGRLPSVDFNLPNPTAGGHPGAPIFEASCNCSFVKKYPWAFGPRIGVAYQITPKTVFRAGFGISYTGTGATGQASASTSNNYLNPQFGVASVVLQNGIPSNFYSPNPLISPGAFPAPTNPGGLNAPPVVVDQNGARPARTLQWSAGLQREIFRNLVLDAAYVGNRGVWWPSTTLDSYDTITPQILAQFGLDPNSATDRAILTAPLGSPLAGRFQGKIPYAGFPLTATVLQSLRPQPQWTPSALTMSPLWAPLGKTWYDSLQVKATKRFSHGLDFSYAFTWQKELELGTVGAPVSDVFNTNINKELSPLSRPLVSVIALNYRLPKMGGNKYVSQAARDWTIGTVLQYASGTPIAAPASNNSLATVLGRSTTFTRVAGVDPFLKDLNCHCIDPNKDLALNPAAWVDAPAGQFTGSAIYFNDYRSQRRPQESISLGRVFQIKERMSLSMRIDFTNMFNRTEMNAPGNGLSGPASAVTCSAGASNSATCLSSATRGTLTGGFGYISPASVFSSPRNGVAVMRFTF